MAGTVTVESAPDLHASHSRRRFGVLASGGLLLAAVLVGGLLYVQHYQPLVNDDGGYWAGTVTGPPSTFRYGEPGSRAENVFGNEVLVGPLRHGGRFGAVVDLHNSGRFDVVVDGIEPVLWPAASAGTQLFVATDQHDRQSLVRAGAFTVPAHGYRTIGVAVDVRNCDLKPAGGTAIVGSLGLHFRFLGMHHTARVPLNQFAFSLRRPPSCAGNVG